MLKKGRDVSMSCVLRRHGKPSRIGRYESSRGDSQRATIGPRRRRCGGAEEAGEAGRRSSPTPENARQRKAPVDPLLSGRARRDDGRGTGRHRQAEPVRIVAASGEIARRWPGRIPADVADAALSGCRPARIALAAGAERDLLRRTEVTPRALQTYDDFQARRQWPTMWWNSA